ncbi:MAG TPA: arginine deiminase family protein [Thermoleophilia bacterium]|nr:arginine deiminase family protein [Thermoleophilia bacterium]
MRGYIDRIYPSQALPGFDDPAELASVWGRRWGAVDDVSPLRVVLMRRPGPEFDAMTGGVFDERAGLVVDPHGRWYWNGDQPDVARVREQHAGLVAALQSEGVEVVFAEPLTPPLFNGVFTRDPLVTVRGGAVIGRLAPRQRRGEEASITRAVAAAGMPVLRTIAGGGTLEGGSFVKIRPGVAALGLSSRCNDEGADQLDEVLRTLGVELIRVPLSGFSIHLDGHLAMLDRETALVDGSNLPYWFLERLKGMGLRVLWRHPDEHWSVNFIALRPGRILMSESSPRTRELLEDQGIEVLTVPYDEIQRFSGGVHCSTMELVRDWPA